MRYRTLLHEVGHWVDFKKNVQEKSRLKNYSYLYYSDLYHKRPSMEKEFFAHNYADKQNTRLKELSVIRFNRIVDTRKMKEEGLILTDFIK